MGFGLYFGFYLEGKMKIGKSKKTGEYYVADYDEQQGRVVIKETSKSLEQLAIKYGFISPEVEE